MRRAACSSRSFRSVTAPLGAREGRRCLGALGLAVTLYRDPNRGMHDAMNRDWRKASR